MATQSNKMNLAIKFGLSVLIVIVLMSSIALAVITVNIGTGSASRLTSLSRQRDRYNCYWDCDLVGCQIDSDDDECAYDCEKICRPRYDWARSAASGVNAVDLAKASGSTINELMPKSAKAVQDNDSNSEIKIVDGETVRLHLPRNATARKFAIWERCPTGPTTATSLGGASNEPQIESQYPSTSPSASKIIPTI